MSCGSINSWDVGNAHFVIFSTEVYFFTQYGVELISEQFNWLEQDLKVQGFVEWVAVLYKIQ